MKSLPWHQLTSLFSGEGNREPQRFNSTSDIQWSSQGHTEWNYCEGLLICKVYIWRREWLCLNPGKRPSTMTAGSSVKSSFGWLKIYTATTETTKGARLCPLLHVIGKRWPSKASHHDRRNKQTWWMCPVMALYWFSNIAFNTFLRNRGDKSSFYWKICMQMFTTWPFDARIIFHWKVLKWLFEILKRN